MTTYSDYQIANGWDNAAGLGTPLTIQPSCKGIKGAVRRINGDGIVTFDGYGKAVLHYGYNPDDKQDFGSILTELGISNSTPSKKVTVTLRATLDSDFLAWNAVITMPDVPDAGRYENTAWQDLDFELTWIHEAS